MGWQVHVGRLPRSMSRDEPVQGGREILEVQEQRRVLAGPQGLLLIHGMEQGKGP
jgi:hypothetical protein